MKNPFNVEARRQEAYDEYVDTTVEVLQRPHVADSLGALSVELSTTLEDSFLAQRDGAYLLVPDEQIDMVNVGIHPMLGYERAPLWVTPSWLLPKHRQQLEARYPEYYDSWEEGVPAVRRQGHWATVTKSQHSAPFNAFAVKKLKVSSDESMIVADRPLIIMQAPFLAKLPKQLAAAVVAHEVDHAVKLKHMIETTSDEWLHMTMTDQDKRRQMVVNLERSAYEVVRKILDTSVDQHLSKTDVAALADDFRALEPEQAGQRLRQLCQQYGRSDRRWFYTALSVGAAALTEAFAPDNSQPTDDEVRAYLAASLID